jgi:hypothetical protein
MDEKNDPLADAEIKIEEAEAEIVEAEKDLKTAESDLKQARADLEELRHHEIHITVDGEPYETDKREMTPNEIIRDFGGGLDPATHYLVRIKGGHKESFQGKGDDPIKLHDCDQFQIISTGPAPVSDGPIKTGPEVFTAGLKGLGFDVSALKDRADHLVLNYVVPTGRFAGQEVRIGLIVPADFPLTPPGGPHVSPHIWPIKSDGEHPSGHIHAQHAQPFQSALGGQWQYWSRPFLEWSKTKKTVAIYMNHIWRLWDTQ